MDKDGSGDINFREWSESMHLLGVDLNTMEVLLLFDHFDHTGKESINYKDFLQMMDVENIEVGRLRT